MIKSHKLEGPHTHINSSPPSAIRSMDATFLTPVVWCILITETIERFSYFGFRAVLVLYFIHSLNFREETAIAFYAYVTCLAYASPMLGAFLADAYWGRFKTILWFGWMYALGLAVLTIGAFNQEMENVVQKRILSFCGLFLVCMGTGGIKPCVSSFGADQVASMDKTCVETVVDVESGSSSNSDRVRAFFASFYFCINLGAVTSISVIPIVKHHFGFGTAFLLPTIFITIAMMTFMSKRKDYVHHLPGQDGRALSTTFAVCVWVLRKELARTWMCRVCPSVIPKRSPISGLDDEGVPNQQLSDAKQVLRVMPIMAMFPMFWMLYDQQSSVWTLQATRMKLHGLEAEQLIVVNPIEIMVFIPLFDRLIYPLLEDIGINVSHLNRMRWGMLLTSVAFSTSGFLEWWIQHSEEHSVSVFWQLPQITILAVAEIFVSVTGLEFAYAMSPERLKAFIMGIYLVMTAVGNFFGGLLYSSVFQGLNRAIVMQICAFLMLCNLAVFYWVGKSWEKRKGSEVVPDMEMASLRVSKDFAPSSGEFSVLGVKSNYEVDCERH